MNDQIADKLTQLIDQISHSIISSAPQAVDLTLSVIRVDAIMQIIWGLLLLIGSIFLFFIPLLHSKKDEQLENWEGIMVMFAIAIFIFSLFFILDFWNWIAIFNTKLALAHQIIQKVIG